MSIRVLAIEPYIVNVRARLPFRYGITTLTVVPHLILQADVLVDGRRVTGLAGDNLPPKWFTKDPDSTFRDELADMLRVIEHANTLAVAAGEATSVFGLWHQVYAGQQEWGVAEGYPPLLAGFGASLIERAVIDGYCRATGVSFAGSLQRNAFGIRLGAIHPELAGREPGELLPRQPRSTIAARHTVGLGDPITDNEMAPAERVHDSLPQSLQSVIDAYGISNFKIKLAGQPEVDRDRLRDIARLLETSVGGHYAFTLDGNENFTQPRDFRSFWESLTADPDLTEFLGRLLFVEQPLHRAVALDPAIATFLADWSAHPPMVIDESDGELDSARRALDLGYAGASHKNCKGVFKGIANACLIAARNTATWGRLILSAEDLTNLGPVALLQDLAVIAALGIQHAERNGHHYFAGLNHLPAAMQREVLDGHADLYRQDPAGLVTLDIHRGQISTRSVVEAPFGHATDLDLASLTRLADWRPESLDLTI